MIIDALFIVIQYDILNGVYICNFKCAIYAFVMCVLIVITLVGLYEQLQNVLKISGVKL